MLNFGGVIIFHALGFCHIYIPKTGFYNQTNRGPTPFPTGKWYREIVSNVYGESGNIGHVATSSLWRCEEEKSGVEGGCGGFCPINVSICKFYFWKIDIM